MPLTTPESGAVTRLALYNSNTYNAGTNRYGLAGLGYKDADNSDISGGKTGNYPQFLTDASVVTSAVARLAGEADTDATAASGSASAAAASAVTAATARDAAIAAAAGAGVTDGDKGDIVVASAGTSWTIESSSVTETKIANNAVTTNKINNGAVTGVKTSADVVKRDVSVTLTAGNNMTSEDLGTVTTGAPTITLSVGNSNSNKKRIVNNGAFTLAAPPSETDMQLIVTNGASAGNISFSGFTHKTGDFDTTNGRVFICGIIVNGSVKEITIREAEPI